MIRFRWAILTCLVLFIFSNGLAFAKEGITENTVFTMHDCIERGLKLNPKMAAWEYEIRKAEDEIKIARSGFLPTVSANYNLNKINSIDSQGPSDDDYLDQIQNTCGVSLTQNIFSGMATMNLYRMKHLEKEYTVLGKGLETHSLVLEIQSGFIKVLMYAEQIKNNEKAVQRLEEKLKAVNEYFKHKMVQLTQVMAVEVELSDARKELSMAKSNYRIQKNQLNMLLSIPYGTAVQYMGDVKQIRMVTDIDPQKMLANALKIRPEILQLKKKIEIVKKEKAIAKGRYSPEVSALAGYSYVDRNYDNLSYDTYGNLVDVDQRNEYWSAGIKVTWPFFEGGKKYYQIKKTDNEIQRLNQYYHLLVDTVTNEVMNSYDIVRETIKRIEFSKTALRETRESYKRAEKRFQINIGTVTEVLDAQAKLVEAETNHSLDWFQYALALSKFYVTAGQPEYDLINSSF